MRININKSEILSQIIKEITGETLTTPITGITTDSRDCKPGDLYIALLGNRSDGHDFLYQVDNINAAAALVSKENTTEKLKLKQICVQDTNKVIGMIANKWRKNFDIPVIAITGSNGKTSTKELLYHILKEKYNVHATEGNYNTSIGLPLSLLGLNKSHDISIIEMGANHPGDIKYLCEIAEPTHGLITNISSAHLEGFQSIENIVDTKGSLFKYLKNGISFINYADERIKSINNIGQKITYGLNANCDFPADIHHENDGSITLTIDAQEIKTKSKNLSFAKNIIAVSAVSKPLKLNGNYYKKKF